MKTGITIHEMAAEILRQNNAKSDYIVDTRRLEMETSGAGVVMKMLDDNGSNTYSIATFKKMYDFAGEQLAQAKAYSEGFKAQIRAINQTRLAEAGNRSNDEYTVYDDSGNNGKFEISTQTINGDRDDLPA